MTKKMCKQPATQKGGLSPGKEQENAALRPLPDIHSSVRPEKGETCLTYSFTATEEQNKKVK